MNRKILYAVAGIVGLIILGWLAGRVGSVGIRHVQQEGQDVTLQIGEPVVPGVDTVVRWTAPRGVANSPVIFKVRNLGGEEVIGQAHLGDQAATVVFPCHSRESPVGVLMSMFDERSREQLLEWQQVAVLAPGPDCLR